MKKTAKLYQHEHYEFADGEILDRDEVTVEPFGKTWDGDTNSERTVWADVDDDSCLYIMSQGMLWRFDGELL